MSKRRHKRNSVCYGTKCKTIPDFLLAAQRSASRWQNKLAKKQRIAETLKDLDKPSQR